VWNMAESKRLRGWFLMFHCFNTALSSCSVFSTEMVTSTCIAGCRTLTTEAVKLASDIDLGTASD
jgi:hypothetical protein